MPPKQDNDLEKWRLSASDDKLITIMLRNMENKPTWNYEAISMEYGFRNASTAATRCGQVMSKLRTNAETILGSKADGSPSTPTKTATPKKSGATPGKNPKGPKKRAIKNDDDTPSKKLKGEDTSEVDFVACDNGHEFPEGVVGFVKKEEDGKEEKLDAFKPFGDEE